MAEDRLAEILERYIAQLHSSLEMMEAGKLRTHEDGQDTTERSIEESGIWIAELENALQRHKDLHG